MLRLSTKFFLIAEVVICFAPVTILLLTGFRLVPIQIFSIGDEPLIWQGPVILIGSVICGFIGLVTLMFVLTKRLSGRLTTKNPTLACTGIALGMLPVIPIVLHGDTAGWRLVGLLPLVATAHLVFLSRRMLFVSTAQGVRSVAIATAVAGNPAPEKSNGREWGDYVSDLPMELQ